MLKGIVSYLLMVVILTGTFSRPMIYAGFAVNKKYIAEKLCVNRGKPVLKCNGKCYLAKKIKLAEEKDKKEERQSQKQPFQEAIITKKPGLSPTFSVDLELRFGDPVYQVAQISTAIFHPPRV